MLSSSIYSFRSGTYLHVFVWDYDSPCLSNLSVHTFWCFDLDSICQDLLMTLSLGLRRSRGTKMISRLGLCFYGYNGIDTGRYLSISGPIKMFEVGSIVDQRTEKGGRGCSQEAQPGFSRLHSVRARLTQNGRNQSALIQRPRPMGLESHISRPASLQG